MRSKAMTYYDHQVGRFEPPALPDDREILIASARRARADATADLFRALYRGLQVAARGGTQFICYAGYGIAKMPPDGRYGKAPAPLTVDCK